MDGIRGIAVLAVLGHNLELNWLQGGFFGVDMFFALSGFLITTLLFEEYLERGTISLAGFFARRCVRLYPALILLVGVSALSAGFRDEVSLERVGLVVVSTLLYFSNWIMIADSQAWVGGMGHTWSLAVEMHFYLGWAVVMALVTQYWRGNRSILISIAVTVVVASALWRVAVWSDGRFPTRAYAGTDTRLDAVFLGVIAALVRFDALADPATCAVTRLSRWQLRSLELFIGFGLAWLFFVTPTFSKTAFLGGFGVVGGATAFLILTTLMSRHSILARPLQSAALVWFGQISYSLYLWHLPVRKLVTAERLEKYAIGTWLVDPLRILISVALAAASYYCVERVFVRLRNRNRSALRNRG